MAAGRCCIVSDTASYSELPRDAVVHIPIDRPIPHLVAALTTLRRNAELRESVASAARRIAATDWSPAAIAKQYRDLIEAAAGLAGHSLGPNRYARNAGIQSSASNSITKRAETLRFYAGES